MEYTQEQLETMSDFEITALVMQKRGWLVKREIENSLVGFNKTYHEKYPSTVWCAPTDNHGNQSDSWQQVNCCYSWGDMGPIIESERINVIPIMSMDASWMAIPENGTNKQRSVGNNPLRCAAIVYLLIN